MKLIVPMLAWLAVFCVCLFLGSSGNAAAVNAAMAPTVLGFIPIATLGMLWDTMDR